MIEAGGFYEVDGDNSSVVPGYATQGTGSKRNAYNPLIDPQFITHPVDVDSPCSVSSVSARSGLHW